jgi:hypothetical protein
VAPVGRDGVENVCKAHILRALEWQASALRELQAAWKYPEGAQGHRAGEEGLMFYRGCIYRGLLLLSD